MTDETRSRLRVGFGRVALAEWIKLRTLRSTTYLLVAVLVMIIGFAAFTTVGSIVAEVPDPQGARRDGVAGALVGISSVELLAGALGVLLVTSEYASGAVVSTFAAVPRRVPVILAKAAVAAGAVFAVSLVAVLSAFAVAWAVLASDGTALSLTAPGVPRALLGAAAYLTGLAVFGVAFGWWLRSTAGALTAMFGLLYVLPIVGLLLPRQVGGHVLPYLPSNAGSAVMQLQTSSMLAPWTGLAVFSLYVVAALGAAVIRTLRSDV